MIHEEVCTYEVCKLAKEKGFNEYEACNHIYEDDKQWHTLTTYTNAKGIDWSKDKYTVAPTQSLLQKWLREEKGVIVEVIAQPTCSTSKKNCYWWSVKQNSDGFCYQYEECSYLLYSDEGYFDSYELALEDALKYALENLV